MSPSLTALRLVSSRGPHDASELFNVSSHGSALNEEPTEKKSQGYFMFAQVTIRTVSPVFGSCEAGAFEAAAAAAIC